MTRKPGKPISWAVEGDLDIFSLQEQAAKVRALLQPGSGLTVDLSGLGDLDPSGLQLLLSLRSSVGMGGQEFHLVGLSESLGERLRALGAKELSPSGGQP